MRLEMTGRPADIAAVYAMFDLVEGGFGDVVEQERAPAGEPGLVRVVAIAEPLEAPAARAL